MFAFSGLFSALPCPFLPYCPRESFCIYSHVVVPVESTPSSSSSSLPARSKPQRSTGGSGEQPHERNPPLSSSQHSIQRDRTTSATGSGSSTASSSSSSSTSKRPAAKEPPRQSQVAAMEAAKRRRQTYDTIEPVPAPLAASSSSSAVLMSRPEVGKAPTKKTSLTTGGPTGPPVLKIEIRAHSKPQFRQTVATQYYNEFKRIYAPLTELGPSLATAHAAEQEKAVHSKTNAGSYRGQAATVLLRLKKRPVATDDEDVGIDGIWAERPPAPPAPPQDQTPPDTIVRTDVDAGTEAEKSVQKD